MSGLMGLSAMSPLLRRPTDADEDLAADLISNIDRFRLGRLTTSALAEEAGQWLRVRIAAISAVMDDERKLPRAGRDQDWLDGAADVRRIAIDLWCRVRELRLRWRAAA